MLSIWTSLKNLSFGKELMFYYIRLLDFIFLDSEIKHFPVSARLFKIDVADQKPQTMIHSFYLFAP